MRAEVAGEEAPGEEVSGQEADDKSSTVTVIRGDLPAAAGLADVWLELRKTLNTIADPDGARPARQERPEAPGGSGTTEPTEGSQPD